MKNLQNMCLAVLVGFVILAASGLASAGVVNCSTFGNLIDFTLNSDLKVDSADCIITGFVKGNINAAGFSVVLIGGRVDGNITQTGAGDVIVNDGWVDGTIKESGNGSVEVVESTVNGNIEESGNGKVEAEGEENPVFINGNIKETGDGNLDIDLLGDSVINGKSEEEGPGHLRIEVQFPGLYKGDANEKNAGDLRTFGNGTFEGNTKEEGTGACINDIPGDGGVFKGNDCE